MSDSFIRTRIDTDLKNEVDSILKDMGMKGSQAIQMMYAQIALNRGLPFTVEMPNIPNAETLETFAKTDRGEELTHCENSVDMFKKLGI